MRNVVVQLKKFGLGLHLSHTSELLDQSKTTQKSFLITCYNSTQNSMYRLWIFWTECLLWILVRELLLKRLLIILISKWVECVSQMRLNDLFRLNLLFTNISSFVFMFILLFLFNFNKKKKLVIFHF